MLKRPFCGMAAGLILGIVIAANPFMRWLLAAVLLLGLCAIIWQRKKQMLFYLLAVFCFLCLGWGRYRQEDKLLTGYLPYIEDGSQLYVKGKLDWKEYKNEQYLYYLSSCQIGQNLTSPVSRGNSNQIIVCFDSDVYSIGEILFINGTVKKWNTASNEGNFDEKSFYEAKKIDFKIRKPEVLAVSGKKNVLKEELYQLRERLKEVYLATMSERDSGIMTTMLLGDKSLLEEEVKAVYQKAGIFHLMAISGTHLSVIGMTLYRLLRRIGMGFWSAGTVTAQLMGAYGVMVGMGTSVYRAEFMFCMFLLAQAVGRSYDSLNSLGLAALIILFFSPKQLFYAGFQFSFAAVAGIVWAGNLFSTNETKRAVLPKIWSGIVIQLVTIPIAAWYYYEVPVYAVLVNLLVMPFMGMILLFGIIGVITGIFWIGAAKLLLFPCHLILSGYEQICSAAMRLPYATVITGQPKIWKLLIYYGLLTAIIYWFRKKQKLWEDAEIKVYIPKQFAKAAMTGFVLLCFLFWPMRHSFELDVLDVGQGDGSFLCTESGTTIFIDGGSSDVSQVGKFRILPFLKSKGIRHIDFWFVSHTDADHISGLIEVFEENYKIRNLVFAEGILEDKVYQELVGLAAEAETRIVYMKKGETLRMEAAGLTAVSPECGMGNEDKNTYSLVLLYEEGDFSGIFTGDIDSEVEKKILERGTIGNVDFYKAAHHGSKSSNSREFLQYLKPKIAAVSCSAKNRYGHPGAEAVAHMEESGSQIFYTMQSGQIKVRRKMGRIVVETFRK